MIYSALTNNELDRWVRNSPKDHHAKAELLRRSTSVIGLNDTYIDELEMQIQMLEDQLKEAQQIYAAYEDV